MAEPDLDLDLDPDPDPDLDPAPADSASTLACMIPSAVGDRQMLPMQTKQIFIW